ncbi:MAG: short-chain fatty acyl-CoA regulator family protein [Alteraurantiacibacter sp. bin_em_oilr2.035]|nr:short-chain fatty acyl-CoA regulator family protein [Alteraurantiacibacter sp. bin_em_oilr2.035]
MGNRRRLFAGEKLRKIREDRGLRQAEMAKRLAISSSYLSQLEHDDRPLTAQLAERLASLFPIDWQDIAVDDTEQLTVALREALGDPIFNEPFSPEALVRLAEQQPVFAKRFVELHELYRRSTQQLEMADDAISADNASGSPLPWEEVRDWFHLSNNYVDLLDRLAENLALSMSDEQGHLTGAALRVHLAEKHRITVIFERSNQLRQFDEAERILRIDAGQPPTGIRFQLAYHVAVMSLGETIAQIAEYAELKSAAARELLKVGLANYAAGAVLMPYEHFRQSARRERHDVDRLALLYRTSFEQACHRLSSLQREGSRGLPVFFCRVDMAGNITKRHSATRLQFARFGGACPLWIVHEAVAIPDRVLVQFAETPDGVRYVFMAKGLVKPSGGFDRSPRRYAVALGCEIQHASEFIYADSINLNSDNAAARIGVSCRICPRTDCDQRAYPPSDQQIEVDLFDRGIVPYSMRRVD